MHKVRAGMGMSMSMVKGDMASHRDPQASRRLPEGRANARFASLGRGLVLISTARVADITASLRSWCGWSTENRQFCQCP